MFRLSRMVTVLIALSVLSSVNIYLIVPRMKGKAVHERLVTPSRNCMFPRLRINHSDITRLLRDASPIRCPGEDLAEIEVSSVLINEARRRNLGDVECLISDVMRSNDDTNILSAPERVLNRYELRRSDFVRINCSSSRGVEWESAMAGIRTDEEVLKRSGWEKFPPDALQYNVLLFGIHSMSRVMFERKLPRTLSFLRQKLEAIEMLGYSIVGDGPNNALFPILTGRKEVEFPQETRKRFPLTAKYLDSLPFIWKSFESNGFVTGFAEDSPETAVFSSRLKGFQFPPTDHYLRPFYLEAEKISERQAKHCLGSIPRHKIMLNYILNFFRAYRDKPKFMVGFMKELTEKSLDDIGSADDDILDWLMALDGEGHLDNTIFIIMSDHGSRHPAIRSTQQGKFEERMPMLAFVLPEELSDGAYENSLKRYAGLLTTPYDLYKTLMNILNLEATTVASGVDEAVSLFQHLREEIRVCETAGVEEHWCTCLKGTTINSFAKGSRVMKAAKAVVARINAITLEVRHICAEVYLAKIFRAIEYLPTDSLMRFRRTVVDADRGQMIDMSSNATVSDVEIALVLSVSPGHAGFEVMLTYNVKEDTYYDVDIKRVNRNPSSVKCLKKARFDFVAYCICKN